MSLRVAIVTESFLPQLNGVTNSVLRVLDSLHEGGHDAIVIAPSNGVADARLDRHYRGYPIVRVASIPFRQFPIAMPHPALARELGRFKPDVVHVASPFLLGGTAIATAKRLGIPTIAIFQTDLAGYSQRYGVPFIRDFADRVITQIHAQANINLAPTSETADYLRRLGVPRVHEWSRGVDVDRFHPNLKSDPRTHELREKLLNGQRFLVGYVGRLAPEKQVERFADLASLRDTSIVIVGDGAERPRLEKKFAHASITMVGSLTGIELACAYAAMDLFVHFGAEETFGQTIQESLASGIPVIAPSSGGPRYIVDHGETGLLVTPHDSHATRRAAAYLLTRDSLRTRMGEAGRRAMLGRTWEANNAKLFSYYAEAMELTGARVAPQSSPDLSDEFV